MQIFASFILMATLVVQSKAVENPEARLARVPLDCVNIACKSLVCNNGQEPISHPGDCCPTCPTGKGCFYKGKFYRDGQRFKDDCNSCWCSNGSVGCTKIGCLSKPGSCPKIRPGTFGICVEACNGDSSCPGDQKCCSNGCGHTCQNPVGTTTGCYRFGRHYNEGDSAPSRRKCETCTCLGGKITCRPVNCPMVMCLGESYTPNRRCCPICRPGPDPY